MIDNTLFDIYEVDNARACFLRSYVMCLDGRLVDDTQEALQVRRKEVEYA